MGDTAITKPPVRPPQGEITPWRMHVTHTYGQRTPCARRHTNRQRKLTRLPDTQKHQRGWCVQPAFRRQGPPWGSSWGTPHLAPRLALKARGKCRFPPQNRVSGSTDHQRLLRGPWAITNTGTCCLKRGPHHHMERCDCHKTIFQTGSSQAVTTSDRWLE